LNLTPDGRDYLVAKIKGFWMVSMSGAVLLESNWPVLRSAISAATNHEHRSWKKVARTKGNRCWGCFAGLEIANAFRVPKEMAPSIPAIKAVETHAPIHLENDVVLGKVIESESLVETLDAGLVLENFSGGCAVLGGIPSERIAVLRQVIASNMRCRMIVFDDHGDYARARAKIMIPGRNFRFNPLIPANDQPTWSEIKRHLSHLGAALALAFGWNNVQQNLFTRKCYEFAWDATQRKEIISTDGIMMLFGPEYDASMDNIKPLMEIQPDIELVFSVWASNYFSIADDSVLSDSSSPVGPTGDDLLIFDMADLHGEEKIAITLMLLVKMESFVSARTGHENPWLVVLPNVDKLLGLRKGGSGARDDYPAWVFSRILEGLQDKGAYILVAAQHAAAIPFKILERMTAIVAFSQVHGEDRHAVEQVLDLEPNQLYTKARHTSQQTRYLGRPEPGTGFIKRHDVHSPFLFRLIPFQDKRIAKWRSASYKKMETWQKSSQAIEEILARVKPISGSIMKILESIQYGTTFPKKKDVLSALAAPMRVYFVNELGMSGDDAERAARKNASWLLDRLLERKLVIEVGFNPSGLGGDVTIKLTEYGSKVLGNFMSLHEIAGKTTRATGFTKCNNDPAIQHAMLEHLREIAKARKELEALIENGDLKAIACYLKEKIEFIIQVLHKDGCFDEIQRHGKELAENYFKLCDAIKKNDVSMRLIKDSIDDFNLLANTLELNHLMILK
ncbi:MAG: hypothetical protein ACTSRA_21480, partial [Promethearchaeota archaeon]